MTERLNEYLAWREENVKRLSQVTDWRELCLELLEAANEMTVDNDGSDKHFNLVADRVHLLAADTPSPPDQPAPPAEGEVAELVALVRQISLTWEPDAITLETLNND